MKTGCYESNSKSVGRTVCSTADEKVVVLSPCSYAVVTFTATGQMNAYTVCPDPKPDSPQKQNINSCLPSVAIQPLATFTTTAANSVCRETIIDGLLRSGDICDLFAADDLTGQAALLLAASVATGQEWLGRQTKQGRVLIINNGLHVKDLLENLAKVAKAAGISWDALRLSVDVLSLRGQRVTVADLRTIFHGVRRGEYALVTLDKLDRMLTEDADGPNMAEIYRQLNQYAAQLDAGFVAVRHLSSGSAIQDVSRDADAYVSVGPHGHIEAIATSYFTVTSCPEEHDFEVPLTECLVKPGKQIPESVTTRSSKDRSRKQREYAQDLRAELERLITSPEGYPHKSYRQLAEAVGGSRTTWGNIIRSQKSSIINDWYESRSVRMQTSGSIGSYGRCDAEFVDGDELRDDVFDAKLKTTLKEYCKQNPDSPYTRHEIEQAYRKQWADAEGDNNKRSDIMDQLDKLARL